ncbi:ABC transporter ATP-binding protein [bacterium]|nr:ABC transporter ATP-binding protein [bacterium]
MLIHLERATKIYLLGNEKIYGLRDVNLSIEKGEYVSVMGPSGSGKSTMLNILGFLDKLTSGRYIFNGEDVSSLSEEKLAFYRNRTVGFIFQTFNLLPRMTALGNVELPLIYRGVRRDVRLRSARSALASVGLSKRMYHRPNELSGGERQRVAIARAIVGSPSMILADEPTGNLDQATGEEIIQILDSLHDAGNTIILVTHEESVARHADRIIRLRDGRVESDERIR